METLQKKWVTSAQTCSELGISRATLQTLKNEVLKPGIHYYRRGLGSRGPIMWNIHAVRAVLIERTCSTEQATDAAHRQEFEACNSLGISLQTLRNLRE